MTIEEELALTRSEIAYEDYIISLLAGKTSEQIDNLELNSE